MTDGPPDKVDPKTYVRLWGHPPTMTEPTLSVCIPTYNQDQHVIAAIESALALDYPNVEIWISDDHSTDQTQALFEALASQHESITYVRQPENLGTGRNVDFLLRQPKHKKIIDACQNQIEL